RCPARWSNVSYLGRDARVRQRRTPGPAAVLPTGRQAARWCCPTGTVSGQRTDPAQLRPLALAAPAIWRLPRRLLPSPIFFFLLWLFEREFRGHAASPRSSACDRVRSATGRAW